MNTACVVPFSDRLCGSLQCDISAITSLELVNFRTGWTLHANWTISGSLWSTSPTYPTFYSGPNRSPNPGLVPDGAACAAGMVTVLD